MADIATVLAENGIRGRKAELARIIAAASPVTAPKREFAEMLSVSEMTVFRYLKSLEAAGIIAIEGRGDGIKSYRFLPDVDSLPEPVAADVPSEGCGRCPYAGEIAELRDAIAELSAIIAQLLQAVTGNNTAITNGNNNPLTKGITKDHNTITETPSRARVIINNNKKGNNNPMEEKKEETETEGAREDHNTYMEPRGCDCRSEEEIAFDEIWERIDWAQKLRYRQTRDVQWKHARKVLAYILGKISLATLMERIIAAVGERMVFGKAISYWLKDNVDMLTACERRGSAEMTWHKFEVTKGGRQDAPDMSWSSISKAVGA